MSLQSPLLSQRAKEIPLSTADIEDGGLFRERQMIQLLDESAQKEVAVAGREQPPAGQDRLPWISRILRPAVLGLEKIAVAAAGDVEAVAPLARPGARLSRQSGATAADRTQHRDHAAKYPPRREPLRGGQISRPLR